MAPDQTVDAARPLLTAQQAEVYAQLLRHRRAAEALEDLTRRSVATALELGLDWLVIAAGLGTPLRATMSWYGVSPGERADSSTALSEGEQQVLALVLKGLTNQAIAEKLYMSKRSLEAQLTGLYRTLGVASKAELRSLRTAPRGRLH